MHWVQAQSLRRESKTHFSFWGIHLRGKNVLCGLASGRKILRCWLWEQRLEQGLQSSSVERKYRSIFHRRDWGRMCFDDVWLGGDWWHGRRWIEGKSGGSSTVIEVGNFDDRQSVQETTYYVLLQPQHNQPEFTIQLLLSTLSYALPYSKLLIYIEISLSRIDL